MKETFNFVTYYRVSTEKQGLSGLGLDAQKLSVDKYIKSKTGKTLDSFIEIESGKNSHRPELSKAIKMCTLTGATLVIAKLDRLSRDVAFIADLQKSDIEFICCDMPNANSFTIGMMSVLAQYERELISERTRSGLASAKRRGISLGNPNLKAVRNTDTSAANAVRCKNATTRNSNIRDVINDLVKNSEKNLTFQNIADSLNESGYKTSRGKNFSRATIHRIYQ